ncbi:MAG: hypothetical protein ACR2PK_14325 [Acidimicrobiales bacterium]
MTRHPAALLVGQGVTLGLSLAFVVIPASARFLEAYGSELLPYVYLVVAGLGAGVSELLTRLQSRAGLAHLVVGGTSTMALLLLIGWVLVGPADFAWASFALLVLFSLQLQLGFVFIGAQAGRILDVQQIKRVFPRIVAGFVGGFMIGGFVSPWLIAVLGRPEHLTAIAALVTGAMAALMLVVAPAIPVALAEQDDADRPSDSSPHLSLRQLIVIPLVGAVLAYQLLSAMGTQLIEYLVYDRAAVRYSDADELANFMADFTVVVNLTDLLVLLFLAGFLMSRFGLRFGVGANPVIVSALVAVAVGISVAGGSESTAFFIVVCAARVSDLTMADAGTRTSINATYQALPGQQRVAAQVSVEGVGGPVALGLTGVLLIVMNAFGASFTAVVLVTLGVCVLWCLASVRVYRRYRRAVVEAARRRSFDDAVIDLTDDPTRGVIIDLARGDNADDARFALLLLRDGGDADFEVELDRVASSAALPVQLGVIDLLSGTNPERADELALVGSSSTHPASRRSAVRALGSIGSSQGLARLRECLRDDDSATRAIAMAGLLQHESKVGGGPVTAETRRLLESDHVTERVLGADILSNAPGAFPIEPLARLLDDPAADVRLATSAVLAAINEPALAETAEHLYGVDAAPSRESQRCFLRGLGRDIPESVARHILSALPSLPPARTGECLAALQRSQWQPDNEQRAQLRSLLEQEIDRCTQLRKWNEGVGDPEPGSDQGLLRSALDTELDEAKQRVLNLVGLLHDRQLATRVARVLRGTVDGDKAMAIEALDVSLESSLRAPVLAVLAHAPDHPDASPASRRDTAVEIAGNAQVGAHPDWLQATALLALGGPDSELTHPPEAAGDVSAELLGVRD